MKLLILGGTVFLGRHTVEAALNRGHAVTLFNRGKSNPTLFADHPRVDIITGDRDGGLDPLMGHRWDAVIDPSGYLPRLVQASAGLLAGSVAHYIFISSISVYADTSTAGQAEDAPLAGMDDPSREEITGETYGPLKALCEELVRTAMPGRVTLVRPGLIVGPEDPSDRFTYWPARIAEGGEVLCPGRPDYPAEFTDVRDLAAWLVHLAERRITGVFNASGPGPRKTTLGEVFELCRRVSGSHARFTWVSADFLAQNNVDPWVEMPLWLGDSPEHAGFSRFDSSAAVANGLSFRSTEEAVRATIDWGRGRPAGHEWRAGITRERETALLKAWRINA